ncbi:MULTISPECIES: hypothetical protein [unclassified Kribbella]
MLTATSYELTASFLNPDAADRARLRDVVRRTGWPQLILRVGC